MKKLWIAACCSLLLALGVVPASANTADDNCAENPLIVDDGPNGPKAVRVANSYICPGVTLEIRTSLNVTDSSLQITAKEILIEPLPPNDPADPAQRVMIINDLGGGSSTRIRAAAGNVIFNGAVVKAHDLLNISCGGANCLFQSDQSEIIAAANFTNPKAGGSLYIFAAKVDIETTITHGGDHFEITASNGDIKLICKVGGDTACKDPTVGTPPDIIAAQCGNPIQYPCNPTFNNAAELKSVCIGTGGDKPCNGGYKEKRFTATGDIDITGSSITAIDHITFNSGGKILADGAVLHSNDALVLNGKFGVTMRNADFFGAERVNVTGGSGCAIGSLCIDASFAHVEGGSMNWFARGGNAQIRLCGGTFIVPGADFPCFNGKCAPPYPASVLEDVAECLPDPPADIQ